MADPQPAATPAPQPASTPASPQPGPTPCSTPGPSPTPTPRTTTGSDNYNGEDNGFEMLTPIHLGNVIEDVSRHYSAGFQDYADAILQLNTCINDVESVSAFDSDIVKEAITAAGKESVSDIVCKSSLGGSSNSDLSSYLETEAETIYTNYMSFGDYAYDLEATIALIENILRSQTTAEEYDEIMAVLANDTSFKNLDELWESNALSGVKSRLLSQPFTRSLGGVMGPVGSTAWDTLKLCWKEKSIERLTQLNVNGLIKESALRFFCNKSTQAESPLVAKSGLTGCFVTSALYFGLLFTKDLLNNQVTVENEIVNAARAGVGIVSGIAGHAVTAALKSSVVGSAAGPLGAGVAILVSIVGNYAIDTVKHLYHYTLYNDMPREYEEITIDDVKSRMSENGYRIGTPKIGDQSVYDVVCELNDRSLDTKFVNYMIQELSGVGSYSDDNMSHYSNLFRRCIMTNMDKLNMPLPTQPPMNVTEEDRAFIASFNRLFIDNPSDESNVLLRELYNTIGYSGTPEVN